MTGETIGTAAATVAAALLGFWASRQATSAGRQEQKLTAEAMFRDDLLQRLQQVQTRMRAMEDREDELTERIRVLESDVAAERRRWWAAVDWIRRALRAFETHGVEAPALPENLKL